MAKLTIKEIAKIAGVSPSAVSIALNNKTGISEETRQKVLNIVEKLQYTPNPSSRRLLFNKTNNITVLFKKNESPLNHFFYSELNRTIIEECEKYGYNLMFSSFSSDDNQVTVPNVIKSFDVDGIIFYSDIDQLILNAVKRYGIPYIVIDNHETIPDCLTVNADYSNAAYTATKYLVSIGHRAISYIGNSSIKNFGNQTFTGFKNAIEECRLLLPFNWIQIDADCEQTAYKSMEKILEYEPFPSAVFCAADIYALGAVKCIKDRGLRIPEDISVIGIDDIIISRYIDPPLTTIKVDKEEMARIAMSLLIKKIEKQDVESCTLPTDNLIIRASTRPFSP